MTDTWILSDTHFNHRNITKFEPMRPMDFEDVIFDNIKKVVKPCDTLWHLGDFTFGSEEQRERVADRWFGLDCIKKFVLGNHDRHPIDYYVSCGFQEIFPLFTILDSVKGKVLLSHFPHFRSKSPDRDDRYKDQKVELRKLFDTRDCVLNVHGHLHSKTVDDDRYLNVSVERTGLAPMNWLEVLENIPISFTP